MTGLMDVATVVRREICRNEKHACNIAPVQGVRQFPTVDPRRTQQFERGIGAASNADIGAFKRLV